MKMSEVRFEVIAERLDLIFVKGKDRYGVEHLFLCDGFDAVTKLIQNWVEKGYEFIGDHEYSKSLKFFEFFDEDVFDKWMIEK